MMAPVINSFLKLRRIAFYSQVTSDLTHAETAQSALLQAYKTMARQDYVVEHLHIEQLAGFDQLFRDSAVFR